MLILLFWFDVFNDENDDRWYLDPTHKTDNQIMLQVHSILQCNYFHCLKDHENSTTGFNLILNLYNYFCNHFPAQAIKKRKVKTCKIIFYYYYEI